MECLNTELYSRINRVEADSMMLQHSKMEY